MSAKTNQMATDAQGGYYVYIQLHYMIYVEKLVAYRYTTMLNLLTIVIRIYTCTCLNAVLRMKTIETITICLMNLKL